MRSSVSQNTCRLPRQVEVGRMRCGGGSGRPAATRRVCAGALQHNGSKGSGKGSSTEVAERPVVMRTQLPERDGSESDGSASSSSGFSKGSQGSPPPPKDPKDPKDPKKDDKPPKTKFEFVRPSATSVLASYGAFTGFVGTLAVGAAWATHINLVAMFDWNVQDLQTGLLYMLPLQVLNCIIMVPEYTAWTLPRLGDDAGDGSVGSSSSSTPAEGGAGSSRDAGPVAGAGRALTSVDGSVPAVAATTEESGAAAASTGGGLIRATAPGGSVSASAWGKRKSTAALVKDAMHLAQGHYTANNPTGHMSAGTEAGAALLNSLASEMLYRGVAITALATWLNDRAYEAGVEDFIALPFGAGPMPTHDASLWAASTLLVALSLGLALRKLASPQRRPLAFVVDARKSRAPPSSDAPPAKSEGDKPPASSSSSPFPMDGAIIPSPPPPPSPGGVPPFGLGSGGLPGSFADVLSLASAVQGARNVAQTLALNTLFVATGGNLAAAYVASLANQLVFSLLQRRVLERTRARSAELAKELQEFNRKLRNIQARQRDAREAREAAAAASAATATTDAPPSAADSDASASASAAVPGALPGAPPLPHSLTLPEAPDEDVSRLSTPPTQPSTPPLPKLPGQVIPAESDFSRATAAELIAAIADEEASKRARVERLAPRPLPPQQEQAQQAAPPPLRPQAGAAAAAVANGAAAAALPPPPPPPPVRSDDKAGRALSMLDMLVPTLPEGK